MLSWEKTRTRCARYTETQRECQNRSLLMVQQLQHNITTEFQTVNIQNKTTALKNVITTRAHTPKQQNSSCMPRSILSVVFNFANIADK